MSEGYSFRTDLFTIRKGEDEETNPGCYGKELGEWLRARLAEAGYAAELLAEDWGWCVVCERRDYLLWVGCACLQEEGAEAAYDPQRPPRGEEVVWHVFPTVELPFFYLHSRLRRLAGRLDLKSPLRELDRTLDKILAAEPTLRRCEMP